MAAPSAFSLHQPCPAAAAAADGKHSFESLDYEDAENMVYRADQAARTAWNSIAYMSLKWGICFLIGEAVM